MEKVKYFSGNTEMTAFIDFPAPRQEEIPCVILCHGYTSYRDEFGAFTRISDKLTENGIGVLRFDFRGCGENTGDFPKGRMLCATEWVEDLYNAYQFISSSGFFDKRNIFLLGMSMGGAVVLSTLKYLHDVKGAIAIAPVDNGHAWLKRLWMDFAGEAGWDVFMNSLADHIKQRVTSGTDEITGVNNVLPFSEEDYKVFLANTEKYPLSSSQVTWSSVEDVTGRVNASRELHSSTNDIPVLFIHGSADTLVPFEGTEAMYSAYPFRKELMLLEGKPHGLLLEEDIRPVLDAIIQWVKT